jgi:hypothetical protein
MVQTLSQASHVKLGRIKLFATPLLREMRARLSYFWMQRSRVLPRELASELRSAALDSTLLMSVMAMVWFSAC